MKKAFDQNVSRAKPRLRFGVAAFSEQLESAAQESHSAEVIVDEEASVELTAAVEVEVETRAEVALPAPALTFEVRDRAERAKSPRPSAAEAMARALDERPAPVARHESAPLAQALQRRPIPVPKAPAKPATAKPATKQPAATTPDP